MRDERGGRLGRALRIGLVLVCALPGIAPAAGEAVEEPFGVRIPIPDWDTKWLDELLAQTSRLISWELGYRESAYGPDSKTWGLRGIGRAHAFERKLNDGTTLKLEIALDRLLSGEYELYVYGVALRKDKREPNPDVEKVRLGVEQRREAERRRIEAEKAREKARREEEAQLGKPTDEYLVYQLSHVQTDRSLALLKTLGYPVVEFSPTEDGGKTGFDTIYDKKPEEGTRTRPLIVNLIDSSATSLVGGGDSGGGSGGDASDPLQLGGQALEDMTSGDPQQRLLIIWENDPEGEGRRELDKILRLLREEIDVPAKQILIEALVIELDKDLLREIGVTFEASKDGSSLSFGASRDLPLIGTFTRPSAKSVFELTATLKALIEEGRARELSRPSVMVLDGRQARIQVGDKIPYTTELETTETGTLASTAYLGVGIVLNLRPRASVDNSEITMQVETLISSAGPSTQLPSGVLVAPPIRSREVQTLVRVANDTPFIIGGLISTFHDFRTAGVPGLSKIPVLGRLFRKEVKEETSKEVIVVITPHVVPPDDRAFTYTIPKGSEIFDSFGRTLFRNIYRVRREDVWDFRFIRESVFYNCLASLVLQDARRRVAWPTPPEDPSQLCPRYAPPPDLVALVERVEEEARDEPEFTPSPAYLTLLRGGIPGEDILVRRMLLGLVEDRGYGDLVRPDSIFFYEGSERKAAPEEVEEVADCREPMERPSAGLELRYLMAPPLGKHLSEPRCGTSVALSFANEWVGIEELEQSRDFEEFEQNLVRMVDQFDLGGEKQIPLDPPKAAVCKMPAERYVDDANLPCVEKKAPGELKDGCYLDALRELNPVDPGAKPKEFRILLNECFSRRGFTSLHFLRNVLALQRLLDLNPSLPLTLEGFHVGREIVFPARDEVERAEHQIDRDAARLFFETMDYYTAFENQLRRAVNRSPDLIELFRPLQEMLGIAK